MGNVALVDLGGAPASAPTVVSGRPRHVVRGETVADRSSRHAHAARRLAGRALSSLGTVLLAMIGASALVLAITTHLSSDEQYVAFGHPVLAVDSGSMAPAIERGDLVVDRAVTPSDAGRLTVGTIVTYRSGPRVGQYQTERIVAVERTVTGVVYVTKGDAASAPDPDPVAPSAVVGTVEITISHGGDVLDLLRTPAALVVLSAVPAGALLAGPLVRRMRRRRPTT